MGGLHDILNHFKLIGMKKKVTLFAISMGGLAVRYAGNTKTLHVDTVNIGMARCVGDAIMQEFGYGLPFDIHCKVI